MSDVLSLSDINLFFTNTDSGYETRRSELTRPMKEKEYLLIFRTALMSPSSKFKGFEELNSLPSNLKNEICVLIRCIDTIKSEWKFPMYHHRNGALRFVAYQYTTEIHILIPDVNLVLMKLSYGCSFYNSVVMGWFHQFNKVLTDHLEELLLRRGTVPLESVCINFKAIKDRIPYEVTTDTGTLIIQHD